MPNQRNLGVTVVQIHPGMNPTGGIGLADLTPNTRVAGGAPAGDDLVLEDGFRILLESGDSLLLEA
jgi:hypothetical protein